MTGVRAQFYKETRELLPWWLGGMTSLVAGGLLLRSSQHTSEGLAALAFAATACGLGGLTIGHEYSHRTLGMLLGQPTRRAALLGIKLIVLALFLLLLGGAAFLTLGGGPFPAYSNSSILSWQSIAAVLGCGFFLAPWLSMVGRGALAGLVFSITLPVVSLVAFMLASNWWPWHEFILQYRLNFLWLVLFTLWSIGGVLTWTTFLRLQALEGSPGHISLPRWLVQRPMAADWTDIRTRNPVWLIVRKELRLQQLTFAISAIYVAAWVGFVLSDQPGTLEPLAWIHASVIPIVIGGLASAEERHLGTASWQSLLPMASAWQWVIKVAVALLLTAALVPGMPFLLSHLGGPDVEIERGLVLAAICVCVAALYISSIAGSGIRAILTAGVAIIVILSLGNAVSGAVIVSFGRSLEPLARRITPFTLTRGEVHLWLRWLAWLQFAVVVGGGAALLLRFGAANHRSEDRSVKRIGRQLAWIFGYLAVTSLITGFVEQLVWAGLTQ